MIKRPHYIALAIVALLTLILLSLPSHTADRFKLAIGSTFLPAFGLAKSARQVRTQAANVLVSRSELLKEVDDLRRTNHELQIHAMQGDEALRQNDQLRALVGWQRQTQWKLKLASIIARDPANWWHDIQIDVGTRDGIKPDMPVVIGTGLVGRISAVGLVTSHVALLGSPECKVAARVETKDTGVITGAASTVDNSLVNLSFLSSNSSLRPGQRVVTSGQGGIFPAGLSVGLVAEEPHLTGLGYSETRVKLAVDFGQLDNVWVMMQ